MKAVIAIIGVGSAIVLLYLGAEVMSDTVDVWGAVKSVPGQFVHYVSNSFSHDMILTAIVLISVVVTIAFIRRVPDEKIR